MIVALSSSHAQAYQAPSAQAASFHAEIVQSMNTGASQYALPRPPMPHHRGDLGQDAAGAISGPRSGSDGEPLGRSAAVAAPASAGNNGDRAWQFGNGAAKVSPAASVRPAGDRATGNGAAGASNFAAPSGSGAGVNGGCCRAAPQRSQIRLPRPPTPLAAGNAGVGVPLEVASAVRRCRLGRRRRRRRGGDAPVASPLLNTVGTSGPNAGPLSGSAGVSENGANGGVGRGAEAQDGSSGVARASGDAGGGGSAAGTIGELRQGGGSFYGSGGDGAGTGAAAAIPS